MRIDLTSIPIADVFERKDGCPLCRMRDMLENRMADYITGAAMMEPDIRVQTNKQGFCHFHYGMMLTRRNRLGVALILESHLAELEKTAFSGSCSGKKAHPPADNCFICSEVDKGMVHLLKTVCKLHATDRDFRLLFEEQPSLCLPHFKLLCFEAGRNMNKKQAAELRQDAASLSHRSLCALKDDITLFCRMFDYRSRSEGVDFGSAKDAIERTLAYLTSRPVE